jgi:hypothetical protein
MRVETAGGHAMSDEIESETESLDFASLADLLGQPNALSIATLASAIEAHGLQGWDRFGRFRIFDPKSPECDKALNALAEEHAWRLDHEEPGSHEDLSPLDAYDLHPDWRSVFGYGWQTDRLPDFAAIVAREPHMRHPAIQERPNSKALSARMAVIGGLMAFIRGELGCRPHPDWPGHDQGLKDLLADRLKGFPGCSSRNLDTYFAESRRMFKEFR